MLKGSSAQFLSKPKFLPPRKPHWTRCFGQEPFPLPPPQRAACLVSSLAGGPSFSVRRMDPGLPSTSTPSILKRLERTWKGNLFGLILLISSTFHCFPWDGLLQLPPQAESAFLKGRWPLGPAPPAPPPLRRQRGEGAVSQGGESTFTHQTLYPESTQGKWKGETPKLDKGERGWWLRMKISAPRGHLMWGGGRSAKNRKGVISPSPKLLPPPRRLQWCSEAREGLWGVKG